MLFHYASFISIDQIWTFEKIILRDGMKCLIVRIGGIHGLVVGIPYIEQDGFVNKGDRFRVEGIRFFGQYAKIYLHKYGSKKLASLLIEGKDL